MTQRQWRIKLEAADRRGGMTLGELAQFVRDAEAAGIEKDQVPLMNATWRGTIRGIEVEG